MPIGLGLKRWLALMLLVGSLVALVLGRLGAWSLYADIFSHLTAHLAGGVAAGLLALIWPRRAIAVTLAVLAATFLVQGLIGNYGGRLIAPATASHAVERSFKLLSFNTWHRNRDFGAIAGVIAAEQPDIVLLIETGPNKARLLQQLRATYPYQSGCADDWDCAIAVLSRVPFSATSLATPAHQHGLAGAVVRFGEGTASLTIAAVHTHRPIDGARTHQRDIHQAAELAGAAPGAVVMAGDFNTTPWSNSFATFIAASGLAHMGVFLPSWSLRGGAWPQLPIDHLFASPSIEVLEARLGGNGGSDHRPLVVRLVLPDGVALPR